MINIRKLEAELWESADLLRAGSKLTSNQYCMPVLGLIFLRYAYSRYKMVEAEILKNRPSRGGRVMPVEASDFAAKSALYLPKEAQYDYLLNLPDDIASAGILNKDGHTMNSLGEITVAKEAVWLYEKFGEGVYADVLGLCKAATIAEIEEKGWSLTLGAYVGVAPVEDDGVNFEERMAEIHRELLSLQAESNDLMDIISQNMKEMGL